MYIYLVAAAQHPLLKCDACGAAGSLTPTSARDQSGILRRWFIYTYTYRYRYIHILYIYIYISG